VEFAAAEAEGEGEDEGDDEEAGGAGGDEEDEDEAFEAEEGGHQGGDPGFGGDQLQGLRGFFFLVLTAEEGVGFGVVGEDEGGGERVGLGVAMEVEAAGVFGGDFVVEADGGVGDDVGTGVGEDLIRGSLGEVVVAVGEAVDEPGGFEVDKGGVVIGGA
jgi:hypothetical protein